MSLVIKFKERITQRRNNLCDDRPNNVEITEKLRSIKNLEKLRRKL